MQITVILLLIIAAFICTIVNALGKCPVWVPLVLLCVVELLHSVPMGR